MIERLSWFRAARFGLLFLALVAVGGTATLASKEFLSGKVWPEPKIIQAGNAEKAPSDAIVLFDGKDLSAWEGGDKWTIADGVATANGGGITTKQPFGDCQVHVEWASPKEVKGSGQGRGNSGIYFMGNYEVQVLDSYDNTTYFDGQCGAIYKQHPPLVNACRAPGEWQSFDILFTAPRFDSAGQVVKPGYFTVLQNGVVVQNHFEIEGTTSWDAAPKYAAHAPKLPLNIQYHGNPVRFRNIWIREL